jgi:hypothetical protein
MLCVCASLRFFERGVLKKRRSWAELEFFVYCPGRQFRRRQARNTLGRKRLVPRSCLRESCGLAVPKSFFHAFVS